MPAYLIALIVVFSVLGFLILVTIVYFLIRHFHAKKQDRKVEEKVKTSAKELSDKFGGRDNIAEITQRGSRVIVSVKDPLKVDKGDIAKTLDSVMFMDKKIVFVIGTKSEQFKKLLEENVGKSK